VIFGPSHNVSGGSSGTEDISCPAGGHMLAAGYNSGYAWYGEYVAPLNTTTWRVQLINPTGSTQSFAPQALCYAS
jgi:hypothetical protein